MKIRLIKILVLILFIVSCSSEKTMTLANGKKVSEKQFRRMTNKAFRDSFGKMTKKEKQLLFDGVDIKFNYADSLINDSLNK